VSLSRDGKRVAFLVQRGDGLTVYHDFRPIANFPPLAPVRWPLTLSADGSRLAWRVGRTVYLDGVPQPIEGEGYLPVLSADGRTLAYDVTDAIVVNGVRGPAFDRVWSPVVSGDGSVVAYLAEDEDLDKRLIVAGARRIEVPSDTTQVAISPDGRRLAWTRKDRVMVEGRPGPPLDRVDRPIFSPDGRRVAYTAILNGATVVVLDDRVIEMDDDRVEQLHFSADSESLGCLVRRVREIYWRELR
jgi:hypothetical protein